MLIEVGENPYNYTAGIGTVLASVYSFKTAVDIGAGPISLLIHLVSLCLLIIGILLIRKAFIIAEEKLQYDEFGKWRKIKNTSKDKGVSKTPTATAAPVASAGKVIVPDS